jgi:hypothetical protein
MSILDPVVIDKYTIYFDKIVLIRPKIPTTEITQLLYTDGSTVDIPSSITASFLSSLPTTFLFMPYNNVYVHDIHIKYTQEIFKYGRRILVTHISTFGILEEYLDAAIDTTIADRVVVSTDNIAIDSNGSAAVTVSDMGIYYNAEVSV